jgi:hypothetical protein
MNGEIKNRFSFDLFDWWKSEQNEWRYFEWDATWHLNKQEVINECKWRREKLKTDFYLIEYIFWLIWLMTMWIKWMKMFWMRSNLTDRKAGSNWCG